MEYNLIIIHFYCKQDAANYESNNLSAILMSFAMLTRFNMSLFNKTNVPNKCAFSPYSQAF